MGRSLQTLCGLALLLAGTEARERKEKFHEARAGRRTLAEKILAERDLDNLRSARWRSAYGDTYRMGPSAVSVRSGAEPAPSSVRASIGSLASRIRIDSFQDEPRRTAPTVASERPAASSVGASRASAAADLKQALEAARSGVATLSRQQDPALPAAAPQARNPTVDLVAQPKQAPAETVPNTALEQVLTGVAAASFQENKTEVAAAEAVETTPAPAALPQPVAAAPAAQVSMAAAAAANAAALAEAVNDHSKTVDEAKEHRAKQHHVRKLKGRRSDVFAMERECACLNWREAYEKKVNCGEGFELSSRRRDGTLGNEDLGLCAVNGSWFKQQDHTYCVNVEMSLSPRRAAAPKEPERWCYVDSSCQELNSGEMINGAVAAKICRPGTDPMLADLAPQQLFRLAKRLTASPIATATMAYTWTGPPEAAMEKAFDGTKAAEIGSCGSAGCYKVFWQEQVWEAEAGGQGPECKRACPSPVLE